jgi:hypothetical protein
VALLGLALVVWLDQLLRQTGRPELVVLVPSAVPPLLGSVSMVTVGALVAGRRPAHPVGWLLLAFGLSLTAAGVAVAYTNYGVAHPGTPAAGLGRPVRAGHHRHRDRLQRLRPAADPDRVVAVAPLAQVGGGRRGHRRCGSVRRRRPGPWPRRPAAREPGARGTTAG